MGFMTLIQRVTRFFPNSTIFTNYSTRLCTKSGHSDLDVLRSLRLYWNYQILNILNILLNFHLTLNDREAENLSQGPEEAEERARLVRDT